MNQQDQIISYLREKYNPVSIMLHGSRATGNSREHSDWDFFLIVSEIDNPKGYEYKEEKFIDQHVDPCLLTYPIKDDFMKNKFIMISPSIKILYDTENIGKNLLEESLDLWRKGIYLSDKEKQDARFFLARCCDRLLDSYGSDNDPLFFYRLGKDFFPLAINYWFTILHKQFTLPPYTALDKINKEDPEYYMNLEVLWSNKSKEEKYKSANYIYRKLFPDSDI